MSDPTIDLTLPAMNCAHCVRVVTETVRTLDAAAQLRFDLPAHRVTIATAAARGAIADALAAEGYPPA